jgi:hypothetical protein
MNKQTQEALEKIERRLRADNLDEWSLTALADIAKEALNIANCDLKQPAQEPAYYIWRNSFDEHASGFDIPDARFKKYFDLTPLYTHPHQWQGLTDDERIKCYETSGHKQHIRPQDRFAVLELSIAIEQALKDKNT